MNHLYLLFVLTFYQLFNAPQIDFGLCQYCNNKIIIFIKCKILSIETILSSYMHVQHTHTYTCICTHTHTPKVSIKQVRQTNRLWHVNLLLVVCFLRGLCWQGHCLDFCALIGRKIGKVMTPCLCTQNGKLVMLTGLLAVRLTFQDPVSLFIVPP